MSELSDNLTNRKDELELSVPDVKTALELRGVKVAYSTLAAWFNGGRKPRKMDHLKALCEVLGTSISQMAGEDPEFAQNGFESTLLIESRSLPPAQREAVLALIRTMRPK